MSLNSTSIWNQFHRKTLVQSYFVKLLLITQLFILFWYQFTLGFDLMLFSLIGLFSVFSTHRIKRQKEESQVENLKLLTQQSCPPIFQLLQKANQMFKTYFLSNYEFVMALDGRDYGKNLRIIHRRENVFLIVPLGYIKFLSEEKNKAEAMFFHEVGHFIQRDWKVHNLLTDFYPAVKFFVLCTVLITCILGGLTIYTPYRDLTAIWATHSPLTAPNFAPPTIVILSLFCPIITWLSMVWVLKKMRFKAEFGADLASAAACGSKAVIELLQDYPFGTTHSIIHPTIEDRILFIKKMHSIVESITQIEQTQIISN